MESSRYSMVLFLIITMSTSLVIASSSSSSNDEQQEIFMVVDDQYPARTGMTPKNPVQIGKFEIGEGKLLTLARPGENCLNLYQPCGALDWCCEGLTCTGFFNGECRNNAFCHGEGHRCDPIHPCCQPFTCDAFIYGITTGTCVRPY